MWSGPFTVVPLLTAALLWAQGLEGGDCDFSCSVNATSAAAEDKCIRARWVGGRDGTKFAVNCRVVGAGDLAMFRESSSKCPADLQQAHGDGTPLSHPFPQPSMIVFAPLIL